MKPVPSLKWIEETFHEISGLLASPKEITLRGEIAYRFEERGLLEAAQLKTARYISGLNALQLLGKHGFFQEFCSIQRILDEFQEDATFLLLSVIEKDCGELQSTFLNAFWEEEPTPNEYYQQPKNRHQVPRKKTRAYIARFNSAGKADSRETLAGGYLSRMYSGFLHGAGPQILEMYCPDTKKFRTRGWPLSPLAHEHLSDSHNQLFRGVVLLGLFAHAVGDGPIFEKVRKVHSELDPHYQ